MKFFYALVLLSALSLSSCMTMMGYKKPIFLGELPSDTKLYYKDKQVKIKNITIQKSKTGTSGAGVEHYIHFKHPGAKLKLTKHSTITLTSGSKSAEVQIKTKPAIGFLIITGIFTLGISPIVDLCTNSIWYTKEKLIDVPAYLNNKEPRTQKELKKVMYPQYFEKWNPPAVPEY
ncbi:MAG: hypothetical protein MUF75_10650 [Bacteroidia bacterium]|jgi:hypothetical protein|nr:hypothetical protein [Bacteroidia bacterium]